MIKQAFKKAVISFFAISPMILGVIMLVAIVQTYITPDMLKSFFGINPLTDLLSGTFIGAISSGNPVISYIVAEELLQSGVSLYAVSAFVLAWVTLGIIQLPAEVSVFGLRFTVYKNLLTLLSTLLVATLTVLTLGAIN